MDKIIKKYIPMTETMFYILLSLQKERHGYGINQFVQLITEGRLNIGAGTMYQSIGKLLSDHLIEPTIEIDRQKRYIITNLGKNVLSVEAKRINGVSKNLEEYYEK